MLLVLSVEGEAEDVSLGLEVIYLRSSELISEVEGEIPSAEVVWGFVYALSGIDGPLNLDVIAFSYLFHSFLYLLSP